MLADLLDMDSTTLARQLVPAALPVFIDQQDRAALTHLARQAGLPLPTLLRQYGHHAVAKHVFEGAQRTDFVKLMMYRRTTVQDIWRRLPG